MERYSKLQHDPGLQMEKVFENSIMIVEFKMHLSSLKIHLDDHNKLNKTKPIFYSVFEEVNIRLISETKP